ncbi:transcriptional regulator, XRE family protein (plasmid) [Streptomyces sp. NBC_01456]|uniref:transcriptional regulator, XRE family protein n=1 Tax=unclassified Streptomyces TaxID=2593676 RepID=UPI002E304EFF|nr:MULTISPECIES: transcriptional regulator, XRE family protein [unclassified Streptomyces]
MPARLTLFRLLMQERQWDNWSVFAGHFGRAARDVALKTSAPRLMGVSVARRTFDRWMVGELKGMPQRDTRVVLEHLLGFPCTELFGPPPDVFSAARAVHDRGGLAASIAISDRWPTSRLFMSATGDVADSWHIRGRRLLDGTTAAVQFHSAVTVGDTVRVTAADNDSLVRFLRPVRRGILVAVDEREDLKLYVTDAASARRALASFPSPDGALTLPAAHELDDLTYGILWSLIQIDDGLLADDQVLDEESRLMDTFLSLPRSALSRETQPGLTTVGSNWLGSAFCAQHIQRRLDGVTEPPVFWTREQTGEEAATWLFFQHKHAYLRSLADRFAGAGAMSRTFCIPQSEVSRSSNYERILLFLAIALMELHGIHVRVTIHPEYSTIDGFALATGQRAVVANWLRSESLWRADTITARPELRSYQEIFMDAAATSVMDGPSPLDRLRALAGYLEIDWPWLVRRCLGLSTSGVTGLARPRSRLITLDALTQVLHFVGTLPPDR